MTSRPDGQVLVPVWVLQALLELAAQGVRERPVYVRRPGPVVVEVR
jgi:hypothetical protein